jgi:hypothetical protein
MSLRRNGDNNYSAGWIWYGGDAVEQPGNIVGSGPDGRGSDTLRFPNEEPFLVRRPLERTGSLRERGTDFRNAGKGE